MESTINCIVSEVDNSSDSFSASLGISEERANYLMKKIMHAYIDEHRYSSMMAKISVYCKHPNELAFVGVSVGQILAKRSKNDPLKTILGLD